MKQQHLRNEVTLVCLAPASIRTCFKGLRICVYIDTYENLLDILVKGEKFMRRWLVAGWMDRAARRSNERRTELTERSTLASRPAAANGSATTLCIHRARLLAPLQKQTLSGTFVYTSCRRCNSSTSIRANEWIVPFKYVSVVSRVRKLPSKKRSRSIRYRLLRIDVHIDRSLLRLAIDYPAWSIIPRDRLYRAID